ncbi:uncharacterized protein LOC113350872 [Papaver somniferum]|uniref:uncharacterized protein LOC113350872 n=1 Tax=Papaver somniferum TaxID=3469 RepID=UPI000E6FFCF3|nr:uncharacterized protein LOC113350872 [Papaver somniferum]
MRKTLFKSVAKDEEDKLKRELAEKKKLDNLAKKGAVKTAPKKKSKLGAKPVEDDGQVVRRGLAKDGARSNLHELSFLHKPDVICIAEPHVFCNVRFVRSLKLVDFCEDVITNEVDGEKDFNCILRPEEKKGGRLIKEVYMNEFRSWNYDNGLVEADAIGFMQLVGGNWNLDLNGAPPFVFTSKLKRLKEVLKIWNINIFGYVQFRLKQAELKLETENDLLDYDPADEFQFVKVVDAKKVVDDVRTELAIMLKMKSRVTWLEDGDQNTRFFHNSIRMRRSQNTISELKVSNDTTLFLQDEIKDFIVNHYQAKFNGGDVNIDPVLFDIEDESISVAESAYMDAIPSLEEVRVAVFDLGDDFAPGLDGFTGSFYRQCWDIISRDLFNAITNCWIGTVLNKLISEEQVAFMKGRNIHENIALASELINEINTERKHGNVGLKLDIAQAFDTVSWDFIAEVFRQYGFSDSWCMWVLNILSSARISVMINGCPEGYFSITRGLCQGDPLSPLIFVLIEDVLSRNISKLFSNHSMNVMVSKKGVAPTHLLFADDILIFCRGNLHSLQNLKNMLVLYERASGQCVNYAKSKFYFGGDRISRAIDISNYLGMERSMFPDKYLGIQLKPGIVRHIHVRQVFEKIMDKLAGWKGKLLSFQARLVLIKSVISSYLIHFMVVYKWPCMVIKQVERVIRNFLWSGDAEKRKYFTVLYDDLCLSKREGGLGIKKLNDVNRAMLMKLWISIRDSNKIWARFLRAKYFKINGNLINYKLSSSVFPGIRLVYNFVQKHTRSIIGPNDFKAEVSDIIFDGVWVIPDKTRDLMIRCNINVETLPVIAGGEDYKIWDLDSKGVFSVKSAKAALKSPAEVVPCANLFTRQVVHPTLSVQYWKILAKQCCASEDNIIKKTGKSMPTMCRLCRKSCETLSHITWHCRVARMIWAWVAGIFKLDPSEDLVDSYKAAKSRSRMIKDLWLVANLAIVTELWKLRNKSYFDNMAVQWLGFKGRVYQVIRDNSIRMKGHMHNTLEELRILNYFKVQHRSCKTSTPIEISWTPPNQDEIMICCDDASFENPGQAGSGVVFRDASSEVLGVLCVGLAWQTNFYAEVCAIIYGAIMAKRWNMRSICIRSDSKSCIQAFQKGELPWQLVQKWKIAKSYYINVRYIHSYREVNFSADASAKQACLLAEDIFEFLRVGQVLFHLWNGLEWFIIVSNRFSSEWLHG